MRNPFELSDPDLTNLNPQEAVAFARRLLWAEAAFTGISQRLVSVPQCINMRDGGLDARIEESVSPSRDDLIPEGLSGFQIKASDLIPNQCKNEVCVRDDPNTLKPAVRRLMDNDGVYVLVLFASLADETQRDLRIAALVEKFEQLGYQNPKVRVYTSTNLVGFANRFPSVVLSLRPQFRQCLNYENWGNHEDVFQPAQFVIDEQRSKIIERIKQSLHNSDGRCQILRILGLSGLGKTRLVYEALSDPDLSNRTIYSYYDGFQVSDALYALESEADLSAIIVVDECDAHGHEHLSRRFATRGERLALITISTDYTTTQGDLVVLKTVSEDTIKTMLQNENPKLPNDVTNRIAQFSEGYPKIAMLLSENISEYREESPEDLLQINDGTLFYRMIAGVLDPSSQQVTETKRVLTAFSLFTKVGWKGTLNSEARWVAAQFGYTSDAQWQTFVEIIREQRTRRVLQGENFLYVTPFPLAVYLLREWLETQGDYLDFQEFFREAPPDMLPRFQERIPYMGSTIIGRQTVERLLGADGPFADGRLLNTASGVELFHKLTEAAPEAALERLKVTVGRWDKETLLNFKEGRQRIVFSLEKIAVWSELFKDAAELLLLLGETETEHVYNNNSRGTFCSLFAFGPGPVASTEAPPEVRIQVLQRALESDSKERILLALKATDSALSTGPFTRFVGPEFQGAKPIANLWRPKTYGELFDTYRMVWGLVINQIYSTDNEIRNEALNVLLQNLRGLIIVDNIFEMILDDLEMLSNIEWIDKRRILKHIEEIIHYDKKELGDANYPRLVAFRDSLIGTDYDGLLKRYVGMNLIEDRYDEDGEETGKIEKILNELALKAIEKPALLQPHIVWLCSHDAENGYKFGYALGKQDSKFDFLYTLLHEVQSVTEPSTFFLGGYLKSLFEVNTEHWEKVLDEVSNNDHLSNLLPELTWRSGITNRAAKRILDAAKAKRISIEELQIFTYGGVIRSIPEDTFIELAKFLISEESGKGAFVLLDMLLFYFGRGQDLKPIPRDLTLQLLTHHSFFEGFTKATRRQSIEYHWKDIALGLLKNHPDTHKELRCKLLEAFGNNDSVIKSNFSTTIEVLNAIAKTFPSETWRDTSQFLIATHDNRSFHITQWLRGERGFGDKRQGSLRFFISDEVWAWVDHDVEVRATMAAEFVPPFLFHSDDRSCYARELLCRYGDRDEVKSALVANFWTEGWSGPESAHYLKRIEEFEVFKADETENNVIDWIDSYIKSLRKQIERARIREELEGR